MNYYEEYGLDPSATSDEIRQAHKRLALVFHPDRFQEEETRRLAELQMKRFNGMYAVLSDARRRQQYDMTLAGGGLPGVAVSEATEAGAAAWPQSARPKQAYRNYFWAVAALVAMLALHWYSPPVVGARKPQAPAREIVRPAPGDYGGSSTAYTPGRSEPRDQAGAERRIQAENRKLRRELETAEAQRDHALAELARLRTQHPPAIHDPPREDTGPPRVAALETPPVRLEAPAAPVAALEHRVAPPLSSTWLYIPRPVEQPSREMYPPEHIEVSITEENGRIRGRYWARYRIADRAISPEVFFRFEGEVNSEGRYGWIGRGGSRGEVRLRVTGDDMLEVSWLASELGKQMGLGSGQALLVRDRAR
ncbi:MAG: DnaJ domain-containing protein [Bryobacteraceae bacterium]|nr:DnaJ domain-containing protein [Bryobacteraceae bacterium]